MPETSSIPGSILASEAAHFGAMAGDWWDPDGASAMLHKLNPVRLKYVRDQLDQHWQCDECGRTPLAGKTGLDASPDLVAVAREHAKGGGLDIDYVAGELSELQGRFDLITCMEVVEHVADPAEFIGTLAARLSPNGLLLMSTPNATSWSRL